MAYPYVEFLLTIAGFVLGYFVGRITTKSEDNANNITDVSSFTDIVKEIEKEEKDG